MRSLEYKLLRIERPSRAIDEVRHAVFLRLRHMVGEAVQFLERERMLLCFFKIEAPDVENFFRTHLGKAGFDELRFGIERDQDAASHWAGEASPILTDRGDEIFRKRMTRSKCRER